MASRVAVVAAGGTGGHMFPAQALAEVLGARGWRVILATDERGALYADKFPADTRISMAAATARAGDPIGMAKAGLAVLRGTMHARSVFKRMDPAVVVGFGGYPSLPALLAALSQKRPTVIHEQNAVFGRVNRFLADRAALVAIVQDPQTDLYAPIPHGYDGHTILREILIVADHNAYHIGEFAILRQVSGVW